MAKKPPRFGKKRMGQAEAAKKWKGKDWFDVISPAEFGSSIIYQTPSTDPKTLVGRNVNVPVSILTGERSKFYMWLKLKIADVKGTNANTMINGFQCMNEYLSRTVRKRRDKIELTHITKTKDGWKVRVKPMLILTRNVSGAVRTSARKVTMDFLDAEAKNLTMADLTKEIIKGSFQMKMKRTLSKTYPVRFSEIGKIKVLESNTEKAAPSPETKPAEEAPASKE